MKRKLLSVTAFLMAVMGVQTVAAQNDVSSILTTENGYQKITEMPNNLDDYYFVIVEHTKQFMVSLEQGGHNNKKTWIYRNPVDPASDLKKVWMIEPNNNVNNASGYAFRNVSENNNVMQTEWNNGYYFRYNDQSSPCEWTQILFDYTDGDYWTFENGKYPASSNAGYKGSVGTWDEGASAIVDGAEVAANKSGENIGQYDLYAIEKSKFIDEYIKTLDSEADFDANLFVVNPKFSVANGIGNWTYTTGAQNHGLCTTPNGVLDRFFENWNGSSYVGTMSQTIKGLPNGKYELTVGAFRDQPVATPNEEAVKVFANNDEIVVTGTTAQYYTLTTNVTDRTLTFGLKSDEASYKWMGIGDVTLKYMGVDLTALLNDLANVKSSLSALKGTTSGIDGYIDEVLSQYANVQETQADLENALTALKNAVNVTENLISEYGDYKALYDACNTFYQNSNIASPEEAVSTYAEALSNINSSAESVSVTGGYEELKNELKEARLEYSKVAVPNDGAILDYTFYIVNPNAAQKGEGWNINGAVEYLSNEHWSLNGTYFNPAAKSWGEGNWSTTISQTVVLPNGTFSLRAAGRRSNSAELSFTANDQTYEFAATPVEARGGTIATDGTEWESVQAGIAAGKTFTCNNEGFGWVYGRIENINVVNGSLTININASAEAGYQWTSISDFQLLMTAKEPTTVDLTMTDAGWATLMLPFDADIQEGMEVYSCSDVDAEILTLDPVSDKLVANTPYIVKAESGKTFSFSGYSQAAQTSYTSGILTGVYADTQAPVGSYVLQNQENGVAFYMVTENLQPTVKANRAYLQLPASEANVRAIMLPGSDATGVESVEAADVLVDVYTVSGIRVRSNVQKSEALKGLKGVYILKAVK